jgi:hypothetical protein
VTIFVNPLFKVCTTDPTNSGLSGDKQLKFK